MSTQWAVGDRVVDEARRRMGVVMDHVGNRVQLRPPAGGREWDADPDYVRLAREDEILRVDIQRVSGAPAERPS